MYLCMYMWRRLWCFHVISSICCLTWNYEVSLPQLHAHYKIWPIAQTCTRIPACMCWGSGPRLAYTDHKPLVRNCKDSMPNATWLSMLRRWTVFPEYFLYFRSVGRMRRRMYGLHMHTYWTFHLWPLKQDSNLQWLPISALKLAFNTHSDIQFFSTLEMAKEPCLSKLSHNWTVHA